MAALDKLSEGQAELDRVQIEGAWLAPWPTPPIPRWFR